MLRASLCNVWKSLETSLRARPLILGCLETSDQLGRVYRCDPTSATAGQTITHDQACTSLYSGGSWEQIGNSIGNVSPMRPQRENTKAASSEPWIRRL